jgi:hypothetical protein
MKQSNRFTKVEDAIIVREIKNASLNLTVAFERAASLLPLRTAGSIGKRWYNFLRYSEIVFVSASGHSAIENRKNAPRKMLKTGVISEELLALSFPKMSNAQRLERLTAIVKR